MTTAEKSRTVSPRVLFRSFAVAEMFTWAGLITALILRAFDVANLVPIAGGIHGFVFLCYSASTIFVWINQRWPLRLGLTGLILAIRRTVATVAAQVVGIAQAAALLGHADQRTLETFYLHRDAPVVRAPSFMEFMTPAERSQLPSSERLSA